MSDPSVVERPVPRGAFSLLAKIAFLVAIVFVLAPTRYFEFFLTALFMTLLVGGIVYRLFANPRRTEETENAEGAGDAAVAQGNDTSALLSDRPRPIEPR
jgi:hypothetical protein